MPYSALASPSATREVLAAHGLAPKKWMSQHFLVDDNIVGKILELAHLSGDEPVLEVGPGIGTLTVALCAAAGHVVALERDRELLPVLEDVAAGLDNLRVVLGDALEATPNDLLTPLGPPTALVANLPYAVAATVVLRCFETMPALRSATVMVQSEVADRMSATPGGKQYGAYTVKLQLRARPAHRFQVSRQSFMPPPRVDSAVLRLDRREPFGESVSADRVARVANAAFAQRRKTLRNSMTSSGGWSAAEVEAALRRSGIDGARRAETLSVEEYVALAAAMRTSGVSGD